MLLLVASSLVPLLPDHQVFTSSLESAGIGSSGSGGDPSNSLAISTVKPPVRP